MDNGKYHSIDPLILQTLNLNERRMNHILDIIHGRQTKDYAKTERKIIAKSVNKNQTLATINHEQYNLPPIETNRKRTIQTIDVKQFRTAPRLAKDRSKDSLVSSQNKNMSLTVQKKEKQLITESQNRRIYKSQKKIKQERTLPQQLINIQEQANRLIEERKHQVMKDYMLNKLKKSKSQEINPKDIYRMEIESLVGQLTPIEHLQQSQKKMQRLKKRYKHLLNFDKNYYLKLNQHDMLVLS